MISGAQRLDELLDFLANCRHGLGDSQEPAEMGAAAGLVTGVGSQSAKCGEVIRVIVVALV